MKVALHGSYFGRNFGDTLLVSILASWLEELGEFEVVLPKVNSDLEASEIGGRKIKDTEWSEIKKLVFAGGGYFGEPTNKSFLKRKYWYYRNYKRHLSWVNKMDAEKIIVGVGFGPIKNSLFRKRVFSLFQESQEVFLRDKESVKLAKNSGYAAGNLKEGVDLAFSLGMNKNSSVGDIDANSKIGIHLPIAEPNLSEKYLSLFKNLLDYNQVELFYDNPQESSITKGSFYERLLNLKDYKVQFYDNPDNLISRLKECRVIITSKLHVGIVATNLGIPVYAVPVHGKTERYYKQIKYESNCNPIYDFDTKKHHKIMSKILDLMPAEIPESNYRKTREMKQGLQKFLIE